MAGGKIEIDVEPNLKGFDSKVASGLKSTSGILGGVAKGLGLAVAAGTGIAAVGLKAVIDKGIEYQNNLNTLQAVSHATGAQMAQVGTIAKALGNDMSLPATSAADAAAAMSELAKGGLSVDQAMTAAKGTLQLAAAAQIDAASAATIQSQALNAFGLSASSAGHVSDVLANAANAASGEITDFAAAMGQVGAVAHQFGLSIDETTTALGLFANAGIKGSDAGTLIKSALLALANPSKPAAKAIETLGLKTYDATGKFVGLKSIFEQLNAASGRMTDQQYNQATATVFGSDAVRLAGVAAGTTAQQWDSMATAIGRSGGAAEVAAAKTKGLGGAIEGFKSQVETVGLTIFEAIAPSLEAGVKQASKVVNDLGPKVATGLSNAAKVGAEFGPQLAKEIESRAVAVGTTVLRLVKPIAEGAKSVVDAGVGVAKTAIEGFAGILERAAKAAQPVADGIGKLERSAATASGPLGAVRIAVELIYNAAQAAVTAVSPLVALVGAAIGVFAGLPGPIQTAAIALLALKVGPAILGSLKSAMSGIGRDAEDASTKTGLLGKAASAITAPIRGAASGLGAAAGTARQWSSEMALQRGLAESSGQGIGRMASAAAAFNTSAIPAVAAARSFRDQTVAIREGAAGAGAPISAMGAAMGTIVERSSGLSAVKSAFQGASDGADRFKTTAGLAAAAGTGIKSAASGLLGVLGGPWGLALAGAGIALSLFSGKQEDAAKAAADHKAAVDGLTTAYKASGGQLSQDIVNTNNKALADANAGQNAKAAGSNFQFYSEAANGNHAALDSVTVSSDNMITSVLRSASATDGQIAGFIKLNHQLLETGGNANDAAGLFDTLTVATESQSQAQTVLDQTQKDQLISILNGTGAVGKQIQANKEARDAYVLLAAAANHTTTETVSLWEAQKEQSGAASDAATANLSYRESLRNLADAQKSVQEALKRYGPQSDEYKGKLFQEETALLNVADAKRKDAEANSKATDAVGKSHDGLVAYNSEIAKLAKSYKGDLPQSLQTVISKMDLAQATAAGFATDVDSAGQAIVRLPNGKEIKITADAANATATVTKFRDEADATEAMVKVGANIDPATGRVVDWQNTTRLVSGNTTTYTNTDPATGKVITWKSVTDASGAVTTTTTTTNPATGAVETWVRDTNGRLAMVKVGADTAAAEAKINNVARDRTVTITTSFRDVGGAGFGNPTGPAKQFAMGGIAQAYAAGGVHRLTPMAAGRAEIVPPNTWRVVGDRLKDDEYYIPDNDAPRSLALLSDLAQRRGFDLLRRYADGGIAGRGGGTAPATTVTTGGGSQRIVGRLDLGNGLVGFVDGRIENANQSTGSAIHQGRRG